MGLFSNRHAGDGKTLLKIEIVFLLGFGLLPAVLSLFMDDPFYMITVSTRVLLFALFAISFDMVWGYGGILSFGQGLFYGGAGFVVALMANHWDVYSVFAVVPAAVLVGLLLAFLLGLFLLLGRAPSMIFIALGSLTGAYAAERLARAWYFLGGQNGITVPDGLLVFDYRLYEGIWFYYMAFALLVLVYLGCRWLVRSQFGLMLAGIREKEDRLRYLGYDIQKAKVILFTLGGGIAGLSGGLVTFHDAFVWPAAIGVTQSTQAVLYVLFGGSGTLIGAVVGATGIGYATEFLTSYDIMKPIWPIVLGLILLVVIMFRPSGLISLLVSKRERIGSFGWRPPRKRP